MFGLEMVKLSPPCRHDRRSSFAPISRDHAVNELHDWGNTEPHRALHNNMPVDGEQLLHKDSYMGFKRHVRSHRPWTIIVFYYPQETPSQRGPTGVVPGSHYTLHNPGLATSEATPLGVPAGSVCLAAFDVWHARMRNFTNQKRFMLKY